MLRAAVCLCSAYLAEGHGSVVWPPSRNAVDRTLAPWNGPAPLKPPDTDSMTGWCPITAYAQGLPGASGQPGCGSQGSNIGAEISGMPVDATDTCDCAAKCGNTTGCVGWTFAINEFGLDRGCWLRSEWKSLTYNCRQCWSGAGGAPTESPSSNPDLSGQNGQSCFWFSNGCSIGCQECDGVSRGPIPNSEDPKWRRKFNTCNNETVKATVCDPKHRTVNRDAECGADDDWFYYSPWRAPGLAPVFDPCGVAGGHAGEQDDFGIMYVNTTHAGLGDKGSEVLPETPGVVWTAGGVVTVTWTIEANHGGGYQYRLAPKGPLTEELFQQMPLEFVGKQTLRYGGARGKHIDINGTYVSEGTSPPGSTWVMNPIPRNDVERTGTGFKPPCAGTEVPVEKCQGMMDGEVAVADLEIIDRVRIPADLPAGDYVLGWRWDCEESNQIWSACSDVVIKQRGEPIVV